MQRTGNKVWQILVGTRRGSEATAKFQQAHNYSGPNGPLNDKTTPNCNMNYVSIGPKRIGVLYSDPTIGCHLNLDKFFKVVSEQLLLSSLRLYQKYSHYNRYIC